MPICTVLDVSFLTHRSAFSQCPHRTIGTTCGSSLGPIDLPGSSGDDRSSQPNSTPSGALRSAAPLVYV